MNNKHLPDDLDDEWSFFPVFTNPIFGHFKFQTIASFWGCFSSFGCLMVGFGTWGGA